MRFEARSEALLPCSSFSPSAAARAIASAILRAAIFKASVASTSPWRRNTSLTPDLQATVTNAIIRRFNSDGTLSVNQNANADSELDITITNVQHTAVRSSTTDILVTAQYQLTIQATATYVNRKLGRKIFENYAVGGSTTYFTQSNIQEGERQALPLAAEDLANNTVKLITEGW